MPARTLTATTARQAMDLIAAALDELHAEQSLRAPDDGRAQFETLDLVMTTSVTLAVTDGQFREFRSASLGGAIALLRSARDLIKSETVRLNPGDCEAQRDSLDRTVHLTVEYNLADLDRSAAKQAAKVAAAHR